MAKQQKSAAERTIAALAKGNTSAIGRREFLRQSALLSGAGLVAAGGGVTSSKSIAANANPPPNIPASNKILGAPVEANRYGLPSKFEAEVVRRASPGLTRTLHSSVSFTPLQDLHGIITPTGVMFERHHGGFPEINPNEHRLMVHGLVKNPLVLTMDEIVRFPSVSRIHFLECGANTGMEWGNVAQPTVQFTHGMLHCAEWTGVLLSTLLDEVGLDAKAAWILAEGADAAALTRSIPLEKSLDDVIVAYAQNGEMLRPENGYPLRLIVPGFQGVSNVKWLRRIKVGDQPWYTREEVLHYVDLLRNGIHRQFTWIQEAKSVITFPSGGMRLRETGAYEIQGLAWSGRGKVKGVDVSIDGGNNWYNATLQEPVLPKCLTRFRLPWNWEGGPALLQSRCTDETGFVQPVIRQLREVRGAKSIYHNNAIQTWALETSGEVGNVQVG